MKTASQNMAVKQAALAPITIDVLYVTESLL